MTTHLPDVIRGAAVTLRRWTAAHAASLQAVRDRSVAELRTWLPETLIELNDVVRFIATASARSSAGTEFMFGVFAGSATLVGYCSLKRVDTNTAEIGYWICTDQAGTGYTTDAVAAITSTAFAVLPALRRIEILCDAGNHASARIAAKNGYRHVATRTLAPPDPPRTGLEMIWVLERH